MMWDLSSYVTTLLWKQLLSFWATKELRPE